MAALLLCREEDLDRERRGFFRALREKGADPLCLPGDFPPDGDLAELWECLPARPSVVLHPEAGRGVLPWGIHSAPVPTVCFQIDVYSHTRARVRQSALFDSPLIFHPGFTGQF